MIVDVEATAPIRQAEVGCVRDMIMRTRDRFGLYPEKLVADTAYGSGPMLGWLVEEEGIEPYIPVIDKSNRTDGTFSREDFRYDRDERRLCLPGRQAARSVQTELQDTAVGHWRQGRHEAIPRGQTRLRGLSPEVSLLPQGAIPEGSTIRPRGRP